LKRHEKMEMALQLWDDMVEKGFGSYTLVSDVLFDMLCDMGKLSEAEKCFLEMIEKGQRPSNVSFKRIKVLMELANKHEAIQNLTQKMAIFGRPLQVHERVTTPVEEMEELDNRGNVRQRDKWPKEESEETQGISSLTEY
jgi:pentatricopeptide repeat protein